nr:RdRp [Nigrospora oryzae unassigned RNA virus 1]UWU44372.1 RdRp [Nigrospora oryzae unassigned RNA virus 1]
MVASIRRLANKWGRVRNDCFSRVATDHPDDHLSGQTHIFWSARHDDRIRNAARYDEFISTHNRDKRLELAQWFVRKRVGDSERDRKDKTANALQVAQATARKRMFQSMAITSNNNLNLLAFAGYNRRKKEARALVPKQYRRWYAGAPVPFCRTYDAPQPAELRPKQRYAKNYLSQLATQGPVPESKVCALRGRLDTPMGERPQKFVLPGGPALWYLKEKRPDLLQYLGPSDCTVKGSWDTNRSVLEDMATQNVGTGHLGDLIQAVNIAGKSLKLQQLPAPSRSAIGQVRCNPVAYPGLVSSRCAPSRKGMFRAATAIAEHHFDEATDKFTPDTSFWTCGGREKPSQYAQPGAQLKSRLVLMPETPSTLLESAYSQPLTRMIQKVEGDIGIGMELTNRGFKRVTRKFNRFSHCKAYDWSGFDTRVREDMIVAAFGIMRACFYGDRAHLDNLFLRFISHTLVKQVATPGGWYYTLTQGVPSGSPFTSLLDSIVNWLVLVDLENQFVGRDGVKQNERLVYGDDFVQGWHHGAPASDVYVDYARRRWGFIAKPKAIKEGFFSCGSTEDSLPFLSVRYPNGLPARPMEDAVRLALLPKRERYTWGGQCLRSSYLSHFPPFDFEVAQYHAEYLGYALDEANYQPHDQPRGHNYVWAQIHSAMADFGGSMWARNKVFNDEWFRAQDPRKWGDSRVPRSWVGKVRGVYLNQPRITRSIAMLKYGQDFLHRPRDDG